MLEAALRAHPAPVAIGPAGIRSVAVEFPPGRLTNAELARDLGIEEEWILSRTGIRERRRAGPQERLSDYATRTGLGALRRADVPAEDLDLVIVATMSQDELTPNTAPLVAHAIGAQHAGAFDVGAACTAFLTGLAIAAGQIESGRARHVLLIGADFVIRITDYAGRRTARLFADAAGAVVVGPAEGAAADGRIGPTTLGADGSHGSALTASLHERRLSIDGPEVFRHAVNRMSEATLEAISLAGLTLEDIDLFIPHQANARIARALRDRLGVAPRRVVDCIESMGNTSAATLPLALAVAERDGRVRPGTRVLLSAFGAGFTWGAGVLTWGAGGG